MPEEKNTTPVAESPACPACPSCKSQKVWMITSIVFIILFSGASVVAGLFWSQQNQVQVAVSDSVSDVEDQQEDNTEELIPVTDSQGDEEITEEILPVGKFNPETIKIGDTIAEMVLVNIDSGTDNRRSRSGSIFEFSGVTEVSGKFERRPLDDPFHAGAVCFSDLNRTSVASLPYSVTDTRSTWFCFENQEEVNGLFVGDAGGATIVIDDYRNVLVESAVWNTATLVSITSQGETLK